MSHPLLELQAAETMADQLRHRRDRLDERTQVQAARDALTRWDQTQVRMRKRSEELEALIARSEAESHEIDTQRTRLESQLRTIIAPREAEALQRQIATLGARRAQLDDAELAALEEQSQILDDLAAHLGEGAVLSDSLLKAEAALSATEVDIDSELARIADGLDALRAGVEPKALERYDRLRQHHVVAAATLSGSRCEGCHLDLSAAEVDEVRSSAAGPDLADCPQCGRLLVV